MAIFSRRTLQRLIDENSTFLSGKHTKRHVRNLNGKNVQQALATEWEVAIINALDKVGCIDHERNFGGSRSADIFFSLAEKPNNGILADITAISDRGLEAKNPFDQLCDAVAERCYDAGIDPNRFRVEVGSNYLEARILRPELALKIPGKARFQQEIFTENFRSFLRKAKSSPEAPNEFSVKKDGVDVTIKYNPHQRFMGGSHLNFKQLYSLVENRIRAALESKVEQLRGTGCNGPLAVLLCDGGSDFFRPHQVTTKSCIDDVINDFLANVPDIAFVLTMTVQPVNPYGLGTGRTDHRLFGREFKGQCFSTVNSATYNAIISSIYSMPTPEIDVVNAVRFLERTNRDEGRSFWGGSAMSTDERTKVKISARALLDLLSGNVTQEEFFRAHWTDKLDGRPRQNPFEDAKGRAQTIRRLQFECRGDDLDDDWITFELEGPDSAIGPFRVPKRTE